MATVAVRNARGEVEIVSSDNKQEVAAVPAAVITKVRKAWDEFEGSLRKSLAKAIDLGKSLIALKEKCAHGEFENYFTSPEQKGEFTFTPQWARKLMRIAENDAIANRMSTFDLPSNLDTVYELATMTAPALEKAIEEGKVTPKTTRAEAKEIKREFEPERDPKPQREKPERRSSTKSRESVYADCQQAIDEAIAEAISLYPELKDAIVAHLRLLVKEFNQ